MNIKELLKGAFKLALSLLILNALLDVASMFGGGIVRNIINNPVGTFTNKGGGPTA